MFHFPKRPGPRYDFLRRRTWNYDLPQYDNVVTWIKPDECCWVDDNKTTLCEAGNNIEAVTDLSSCGNHASPAGTTRMKYVLDSGFPAIQTIGDGTEYSAARQRVLRTVASFAISMMIIVMRSANPTWNAFGTPLGRYCYYSHRSILYSNTGTGWNDPPVSVQRCNGVDMAIGSSLVTINVPMILTLGCAYPGDVTQWELGSSSDSNSPLTYISQLFLYEIIGFSSVMPTTDIQEVEAYLMDKYGIA